MLNRLHHERSMQYSSLRTSKMNREMKMLTSTNPSMNITMNHLTQAAKATTMSVLTPANPFTKQLIETKTMKNPLCQTKTSKTMKSIVFPVVALFLLTLLSSCNQEQETPTRNLVLVDFSGSISSSMLEDYQQQIQHKIIGRAGKVDKIQVLPIDAQSVSAQEMLFAEDMSSIQWSLPDASPVFREKMEQERRSAILSSMGKKCNEQITSAFHRRQALANGTNITGALKALKPFVRAEELTRIYIFSDMIQYGHDVKLTEKQVENIQPTILQQVQNKLEPVALGDNVEVYVITGINVINDKSFEMLRAIWVNYFEQNGMKLKFYGTSIH
jgi:hypothetical protein